MDVIGGCLVGLDSPVQMDEQEETERLFLLVTYLLHFRLRAKRVREPAMKRLCCKLSHKLLLKTNKNECC